MHSVLFDSMPSFFRRAVPDPVGPVGGSRVARVSDCVWPGQYEACIGRRQSGTEGEKTGVPASFSCPCRRKTAAKTGRRHLALRGARGAMAGSYCMGARSGHDDTVVWLGQQMRRMGMAGFLHGAFPGVLVLQRECRQSAVPSRCSGIPIFSRRPSATVAGPIPRGVAHGEYRSAPGNRQPPPGILAADGHLGPARGARNGYAAMKCMAIRPYRIAVTHSGAGGVSVPFGVRSAVSGSPPWVFENTYAPARH